MQFKTIVCGGTFDHLHRGHIDFILFCFKLGEKVIIGLTSDIFVSKYKNNSPYSDAIQNFSIRKKILENLLKKKGVFKRSIIVSIDNIYGPTIIDNFYIDAIIVSRDRLLGAEEVNKKRISMGLSSLPIIEREMVLANDGQIISSSRIREGLINRNGRKYILDDWLISTIILSKKARKICKKPFGSVITELREIPKNNIYIVGDITTLFFNSHKIKYDLAIFDLYVERKRKYNSLDDLGFSKDFIFFNVNNSSGTLTPFLFKAIFDAFDLIRKEKKVGICILGEEDLSVLPLLLQAPLYGTIFYGQPGMGMVQLEITEKNKEKAFKIVDSFMQ
ncbi:hypothetical protein LBMAG33_0150 [Candidatus Levyibacteriota bacterium]|nr:pantetheine-phosphate adenylyltransferase [Candidatus Levybacteria bacterium]MSU25689.1 DUF359 domain-containing protein [Candidatus Levybacteria bacterium]GDX61705.1 hypothetical protein LBMAG33_0150 [Candidatus Levybacteria bacterium]